MHFTASVVDANINKSLSPRVTRSTCMRWIL